jgi:hypothetical protein
VIDREIRRRVCSLLRLASNTSSENEAEVARRRARDLMAKHGIEIEEHEIHESTVTVKLRGLWQRDLLIFIAETHECKVLRNLDSDEAMVVGDHSDVRTAVRSFEMVSVQVLSRATSSWQRVQYDVLESFDAITFDSLKASGILTVMAIEMISTNQSAANYFGPNQSTYAEKLYRLATNRLTTKSLTLWNEICRRVEKARSSKRNDELRRLYLYTFCNAVSEEFVTRGRRVEADKSESLEDLIRSVAKIMGVEIPTSKPTESEVLGKVFEDELRLVGEEIETAKEESPNQVSKAINAAMLYGKRSASYIYWRVELSQLMATSSILPTADFVDRNLSEF